MIIWDDAKQKVVITLEFRSQVNRVCLSRSRIVIALHNSVHIYTFASPPEKVSIFETAENPQGLCCLGSKVIAFPGRTPGQVQMVEIGTGNVSIIPAHSSPLRAMALSPDGEILATASETVRWSIRHFASIKWNNNHKGTLVRIFSTRNCARIEELRRGVDHAIIYSIAISPNSALLAVSSDKATLHIFDLPHSFQTSPDDSSTHTKQHRHSNSFSTTSSNEEGNKQKWGILGRIPLLPRVFSDVYSFASAHFEIDDDPQTSLGSSGAIPIPGIPGGKARKGIIGWTNDWTILVIGAGRDGRWEKFILGEGEDGKRYCIRNGWKRYLGS